MFDWKISVKKGLIQFAIGVVSVVSAGIVAVYGENSYYLALAPIINGALSSCLNWLKHKED